VTNFTTWPGISPTASALELQNSLENIGANVSVTRGPQENGGFTYDITFKEIGERPIMMIDGSNLVRMQVSLNDVSGSGSFTIGGVNGTSSSELPAFANASEVQSALEPITRLYGDVTRDNLVNGGYRYNFTFEGAGDKDLLTVNSRNLVGGMQVNIIEVVKGQDGYGTFSVTKDGQSSDPISLNATAEELLIALKQMNLSSMPLRNVTRGPQLNGGYTYNITFAGYPCSPIVTSTRETLATKIYKNLKLTKEI
jgi:hypothetical protein